MKVSRIPFPGYAVGKSGRNSVVRVVRQEVQSIARKESVARDTRLLLGDNKRTVRKRSRWRARLAVSLKCESNQVRIESAGDDVVVAGGGFGLTVGRDGRETISG